MSPEKYVSLSLVFRSIFLGILYVIGVQKKITTQNSLKSENSELIHFIVGKFRSFGLIHSVLCCIVNKKENFFLITMFIGNKQTAEQKR